MRMKAGLAFILFLLYAGLTGVTLSTLFLILWSGGYFIRVLDDSRDIFPRVSGRLDNQEGSLICGDGVGNALVGLELYVVYELVLSHIPISTGR